MRLIATTAPAASGRSAAGIGRSIARTVAFGEHTADAGVRALALDIAGSHGAVGKVHSAGTWQCPAAHTQLAETLGDPLGHALRPGFEWYYCRGAFFHNDAHYDARLFGVWCIVAPPMELVFPRTDVRVAIAPGRIVVFDPFEVHGVLAPGRTTYAASDYESANPSVFLGFELDITPTVAEVFDIRDRIDPGAVISSQTRIDATSGKIA
ncbi:MAG: hypothetical protein H0T67_06540 [Burkholderiaceae bacterium]|nr:hypothetical protein [Burkholderiaceae bacterium]